MNPRAEHPKPQFERETWMNLNGEWSFELDNGKSGVERGLFLNSQKFSSKIMVPFCPESKLSGIEHKDFMYGVWYKRSFALNKEQVAGRTCIHFGAVDYGCNVYVNEHLVGTHQGGYVSFFFDISKYVMEGENTLTVYAWDDVRSKHIPRGKQCEEYYSRECAYTRTTGIWQTVWLEFTPKTYIKWVKYYPDAQAGTLAVQAELEGAEKFELRAFYEEKLVGQSNLASKGGIVNVTLPLVEIHLWEPGHGRVYDLDLKYGEDRVKSYFGLRNIRLDGMRFLINDKSVFQRLVLDQGFYPDGVYTAPSDEALRNDIQLAMNMGFNGARLHQKVVEERFLYHCDKMGYLVWAEFPNWGLDHSRADSIYGILPEWIEEIHRDFNHPSIIGWCPFNETWDVKGRHQYNDCIRLVYDVTKSLDPTRPCIDTSGNYHVKTDIYDVHDYEQKPDVFRMHYDKLMTDGTLFDTAGTHCDREGHLFQCGYHGEPTFVSEYGGIQWSSDREGWGYGEAPKTKEEFIDRFTRLTEALIQNNKMFGLCYTQLTDVEQEQNGLHTYDRRPKFEPEIFKSVLSQKAAIED